VKVATLANGAPDGRLVLVSGDNRRYLDAADVAPSLQQAIEEWDTVAPRLAALSKRLDQGHGQPVTASDLRAPLPRAWPWLDGSAYESHGELMDKVFGMTSEKNRAPTNVSGIV
jgi:fumarylacetoacetate (FAA) hydrolase